MYIYQMKVFNNCLLFTICFLSYYLYVFTFNKFPTYFNRLSITSNKYSPKIHSFHKNKLYSTIVNNNDNSIPTEITLCPFHGAGDVLIITPNEYDHFLMQAAIFLYSHDKIKGSQGVILTKQTAFTMGEVSPGIGLFEANTLYMGGENGMDMAIMLHSFDLQGSTKYIGNGIYLGGLREAQEFVKNGNASPKDFKFFFNYVDWAPGLLEKEIEQGRWDIVRVPPNRILTKSSAALWKDARNLIASNK